MSIGIPFLNDGGAILVLPEEALPFWGGGQYLRSIDPLSSPGVRCDIDRAMDAERDEMIRIGASWGLILHEAPPIAQFIALPNRAGFLVVVTYYSEMEETDTEGMLRLLSRQSDTVWQPHHFEATLQSGKIVLCSSGAVGEEFLPLLERLEPSQTPAYQPTLLTLLGQEQACAYVYDAIGLYATPGTYLAEYCVLQTEANHITFHRFQLQSQAQASP